MGAFLGLSVASCADQNFDWEDARNQNPEYTFRTNFEKLVGKIDPNQSWDFSSYGRKSSTRAEIVPQVASDWYYVEQSSIDYFNEELVEGQNNRAKGNPFIMSVPNNGFGILPIHQGGASWLWDLHMVIEQGGEQIQDVTVWEKHRDLECQLNDETLQIDVLHNHNPQRNGNDWYGTKQAYSWNGGGWWENYEYGWNTLHAKAVRSKFINFNNLPVGANIYFYLNVWSSLEDKNNGVEGRKESSLNQMMVALTECERPTNIDEKNEVMIIGCEDNHVDGDSDWDMNDLVFMVVGYPNVPKPIVIRDDKYDEVIVSKRYMVEDLGSTAESDIDFNDIVIDLEQYKVHEIEFINGAKVSENISGPFQRARVMALGGTLDFFFLLKNTDGTYQNIYHKAAYKDYKKMLNTDAATMSYTTPETDWFDISGWDPTTNNVAFLVCRDRNVSLDAYVGGDTEGCYISNDGQVTLNGKNLVTGEGPLSLINFPQTGETPFIVAFDTDKQWRDERHKICSHWLYGTAKTDGKACEECGE